MNFKISLLSILFFTTISSLFSQWNRDFGSGWAEDEITAVIPLENGEFLATGTTTDYAEKRFNYTVWLMKFNNKGDSIWARGYGSDNNENGNTVIKTNDGNFLLSGTADYDGDMKEEVFLLKIDQNGDTIWSKNYGGASFEYLGRAIQTPDSGFVVAASSYSFGNGVQFYILKTDKNGDTLWTKNYGGAQNDYVECLTTDNHGRFYFGGFSKSFGGKNKRYLIKLNSEGDTLWTKYFPATNQENIGNMKFTKDNHLILCGASLTSGSTGLSFIMKLDTMGNVIWEKYNADLLKPEDIIETKDGGYAMIGYAPGLSPAKTALAKTDKNGKLMWSKLYKSQFSTVGFTILENNIGGYLIAGYRQKDLVGNHQGYVVYTDSLGEFCNLKISVEQNNNRIYVSPKMASVTWFDCTKNQEISNKELLYLDPPKSGVYSARAEDFFGCIDTSDCETICIKSAVVSQGEDYLYTTSEGKSYQWFNCTTKELINGQTDSVFTYTEDGEYAVIVTDDFCSDTSECFTIMGMRTEGINSSQVSIYPNPNAGSFTIDASSLSKNKILDFIITDFTGKIVYSQKSEQPLLSVQIPMKGMFFITVKDNLGNVMAVRKVVAD